METKIAPSPALSNPALYKTNTSTKLFVVLPAYNEEASLGKLLSRIKNTLSDVHISNYEVIVVNDGSEDNTIGVAKNFQTQMPLTICQHEVNQGLGATIRDGLQEAARLSTHRDVIISMDADDTHTPGLMPRMLQMIAEGHDVVIASRYQQGSRIFGLTRLRRLMSYGASWMFRILFPIKGVRDFTCGYRAYRATVIKQAFEQYDDKFIDQDGFQAMVDILLKLRKMNLIFGEVPFILRYDMKEGASKMNVSKTVQKTFKLIAMRLFQ